jgi:TolA-binding protein
MNLKALFFISGFIFFNACLGFAATDEKANSALADLSKQIIEAKSSQELGVAFNQLKELYFKDNKYGEFVEFLKSLSAKKKMPEPFTDYYIALSRYSQLKYLEEKQNWDEYFAKGNAYRDEITAFAKKAIDETGSTDALHLYSQLLLWQFHKGQEDALLDESLSNLMQSALEYSRQATDPEPLKKAADTLLAYGEKAKSRELYKIYVDKLVSANTKTEELSHIALSFYKEGNLDLSEYLYNIYIDRMKAETTKERFISDLINIARQFSYKDQGQRDPLYAEKIFKKIEETGGKEAFDQELMYLRGFNLEKIKDYLHAQEIYLGLLKLYPESTHAQELNFKIGIIQTYVLRDIEKGKIYFEKLAREQTANPWVISSLYQLGLINQWQGDSAKARDYYNRLIEKSGSELSAVRALADERLKEIDGQKSIEYNLKMFLDVSLKEGNPVFNPAQIDLRSSAYLPAQAQELNISAFAYAQESGCMQPQLKYLWSGDLGDAKPTSEQANFSTKYLHAGTKVINLVVLSSADIIDRTFDMLDAK